MKMNSEKVIYFTQINEYSEDLTLLAAEAANKYHGFYILSFDEEILKYYRHTITPLLDEGVAIEYTIINKAILASVVKDFIRNIIKEPTHCIYHIDLISQDITRCDDPIELIKDFIKNKSHAADKDYFERYLNESSLSVEVKFEIIKIYSIISNMSKDVDCFFKGDSFIIKDKNMRRYNYSALDSLRLEELEILIQRMELYKNTEYTSLSRNVTFKIKELKAYFNFVPSTIENINNRQVRSNYNHGGFPSIYKLISVIQFESALTCLKAGISNSAFLHLIRSLDVYIDGYLILLERASLGDYQYIDRSTGKPNRFKDVFLLNGRMVTGITQKINEINDFLDESILKSVKCLIQLRNSLILTHGNVKVCHDICREAVGIVRDAILNLDDKIQHGGFTWFMLRQKFKELMDYTYVDNISDCLYKKYGIEDF